MRARQNIYFRIASYTDAAGKFSPGAFRCGNEDNFYVNNDLTDNNTPQVYQDEIMQLGSLGMLMVVADGMGGMNAGEIASQIAIDTVREAFKIELLTDSITATSHSRQIYIEQTIREADKNIKIEAQRDISRNGMGSTIIVAWLYNNELSISWCGDSRAYIFNEKSGIRLVSQDHSYVQDLVNKGMLTYEQTFDHPQNNIVTRSLGDPTKEAKPESKTIVIGKGDIILLCSDGLTGVLRDRKTYDTNGQLFPEDNMEDIIRANMSSMKECREALWLAAERAGWYDNVTVVLCQITDGPESKWTPIPPNLDNIVCKKNAKLYIGLGIILLIAIVVGFYIGKASKGQVNHKPNHNAAVSIQQDSNSIDKRSVPENKAEDLMEIDVLEHKPTVQKQIKMQTVDSPDTTSVSNELTIIKSDDTDKSNTIGNRKLTPIKDNGGKDRIENPLITPDSMEDNINSNPEINQNKQQQKL